MRSFTFLGHAAVRCDLADGRVMLIDPFLAENPSCPPPHAEFDRLDAMLITHGHGDHMADAVRLAKQHQPEIVVGTVELCGYLAGQGVENCSGMNLGGTQAVLDTRVTQVPAQHTAAIEHHDRLIYGGVASGYVIRFADGATAYHAGDTALFSDMKLIAELYRPTLGFLPIGDHYTMGPRAAAHACRFLQLEKVVPIHYGTWPILTGTPDDLRRELDALGVETELVELAPGETVPF